MSARRAALGGVVVAGLAVALAIAMFLGPFASSSPDGLEKVAHDKALDAGERSHTLADSPLADYQVAGVDHPRTSTALAGAVGVLATFALGSGAFLAMRAVGRRNATRVGSEGAASSAA